MVLAAIKHHDLSTAGSLFHILIGLFRVQVAFKQVRLPLHKGRCHLCGEFPGIGDPRTGDEDQWVFGIRNSSHPALCLSNWPPLGFIAVACDIQLFIRFVHFCSLPVT